MFPTLFQLATKSAVQGIHNGRISFDFDLDTESSNTVFKEVLELDPKNIDKLKTYKNQLSTLKELDLRKCKIDEEGVLNLKNFNLSSLEFGDLNHLKTEFPDPMNILRIEIVSLLKRAANPNTQRMMVHLGFSGREQFISGWEEKVSKLLPSLQSFKIISKVISERCQFSKFCNSFPNLLVLDISHTKFLPTLKGIKNLENLQKLVMHNVPIEDIDGYKELSELNNLKVLDFSGEVNPNNVIGLIPVIEILLTNEIRMENLEFLDCSMTSVEEHQLREFVEQHPKLKTVVAICTKCEHSYIPTIDLLNFLSTDSTLKSLEYALTNDRDDLSKKCMSVIIRKLDRSHGSFHDSEISGFLNALCKVLRESKNEMNKFLAILCFGKSNFFETERFFTSFSLEIPCIVELIFKSWESLKGSKFEIPTLPSVLSIFNRIVRFLTFGRILQDRLLNFIMEKTVALASVLPQHYYMGTSILSEANRFMSLDQYTSMFNNTEVIKGLFEFAHLSIKNDPISYQLIMEIVVSYLNQASENTLKYLVSNCQAVEKCFEQVMIISGFPRSVQKNLSQIVSRLMSVIDTNRFRDSSEKMRALLSCSIVSVLLAKNLIDNREDVNTKIKEFNESWDQSDLLDCQLITGEVLNVILTSEHSTDESIRFGLIMFNIQNCQ
ncbi:unnamed protein product [Caenorhabditis nigoni]